MKTINYLYPAVIFMIAANACYAQTGDNHVTAEMKKAAVEQAAQTKTLTTLDLLSNLYQIAANDLTADSKSIKFKSTIFGVEKVFDPKIDDSRTFQQKWLERYLEPYLNLNYKNKFDPSALSMGANFSFINANDKAQSNDLNDSNPKMKEKIGAIDKVLDTYIGQLTLRFQPKDPNNEQEKQKMKAAFDSYVSTLNDFLRGGDETGLSDSMKTELTRLNLLKPIESLKTSIDSLATRISNRWNVSFSPEATYAFNKSAFQGVSLLFNAIKGANLLPGRSTQFTLKAGYVFGDDTIITVNRLGRNQMQTQFGFNQVIFKKSMTADDGTTSKVPCTELAIGYGLNYITRGYLADEKRRQPSLNAKLGFLIGKDSWLVIPFTYNYATKITYASVSVKINLGDAPFKATQ